MRALTIVLLSLLFAAVASVGGGRPAIAGGNTLDGITGVWEGRLVQGATGDSPLRLEVFSDGRWKIAIARQYSIGPYSEAEGTVNSLPSGAVMLSGKYTWHSVQRFQGSAVTMTLKQVSDVEISGDGISTQVNRPFSVSLKRVK